MEYRFCEGESSHPIKYKHLIVEASCINDCDKVISQAVPLLSNSNIRLVSWGASNTLPNELLRVLLGDTQGLQMLKTQVAYLLGAMRLQCYTYNEENISKRLYIPDVDKWIRANRLPLSKTFKLIAHNLVTLNNAFVLFKIDMKGALTYEAVDAITVRAHQPNDMQSAPSRYEVFYNIGSPELQIKAVSYDALPSDFAQSKKHYGRQYILHLRPEQTGFPIYAVPEWIGAVKMLELRNSATNSLAYMFKNMYNFKYVVYINEEYYKECINDEQKKAKYDNLVKTVDNFFAGVENTGKTIYLREFNDAIAKEARPYVHIEAVKDEIDYEGRMALISGTNNSTAVNFGISPTLNGLDAPNQLPSGGEMFYSDNHHLHRKAIGDRMTLMEFVWQIFGYYGWTTKYPIEEINFLDTLITQLADNASGVTTA